MRNFNYILILFILLTGSVYNAKAQDVQAEAKLDRTAIKIGEQTQLHLVARFHVKDKVEFPALADSIGSKVLIVGSKIDTIFDKDDVSIQTIRHNYTITSFDSGQYAIPAYAFHTTGGDVKTQPLTLQVATVAVDTTKAAYDIKQPLAISYTFWDWLRDNWVWVVGALAVILIIGGIIYYLRTRPKKVEVVEPPKPVIPAYVTALQKLAELRDKKLWQQEQTKQYHTELTDVIRDYLESRYAIQAQEQTSDEIFASLRYMDISEENRNLLRQMLILADLVKFAKEKPLPHENEQSLDNAVAFVNNTKQVVQTPVIKGEDKK
ncbi:BatD family protein [Mucilaginibacter sabulilitoris]|uniref:BatD family protein n=1 Tax=Mucilaginibacter sabulilitoris TaxID=1173583 RepID=A0ABZ0TLC4_9SPHI|nr:BatD family protein [Mucilaginibacter sabulilitoris]WPU93974.1 BatD family protein [Mucilaginibacter sabulilitoris]